MGTPIDPIGSGLAALTAATASAGSGTAAGAAAGTAAATAAGGTAATIGAGINAAAAGTAASGSFLTGTAGQAALTAASAGASIASTALLKPKTPAPQPKPPNFNSMFLTTQQNSAAKASGALGGTFLTQGQKLGSPKTTGGASLLGS